MPSASSTGASARGARSGCFTSRAGTFARTSARTARSASSRTRAGARERSRRTARFASACVTSVSSPDSCRCRSSAGYGRSSGGRESPERRGRFRAARRGASARSAGAARGRGAPSRSPMARRGLAFRRGRSGARFAPGAGKPRFQGCQSDASAPHEVSMRVLDPGHRFSLRHLDGPGETVLQFVKREGRGYPHNVGTSEGTTLQEVLRALISRAQYVNGQIPCPETDRAIDHMMRAVHALEVRAARRHGRNEAISVAEAVSGPTCAHCGHVGCVGSCRGLDSR